MAAFKRYFLSITYAGTEYHGWQRQHDVITVQGTIEAALARLQRPVLIYGSSRTDAGVHALGQTAHIDLDPEEDPLWLLQRVNRLLPPSIYIPHILPVPNQANARFDALYRRYCYSLTKSPNPFRADTHYHFPYKLDVRAMNQAASCLLGTHNCRSFCKGYKNVSDFICHITTASWEEKEDQLIFTIQANRFVHGMVRAIVGTLVEVGRGVLAPSDMPRIIAQRERSAAKSAAPPQGLFLMQVGYPENLLIQKDNKLP